MENIRERRLRLWKARQEAEGYDVSKVRTLEEAEHFFDKKRKKTPKKDQSADPETHAEEKENATQEALVADTEKAAQEAPELPAEEVIEDEQCDIDPVDEPV